MIFLSPDRDAPSGKTIHRFMVHSDKFLSSTSFRLVVIIMAVNDEKHLLHHILGAALHLQIINDKRVVLVKAGDKVSLVLKEHPPTRGTVRNSDVRSTCWTPWTTST